MEAHPLRAGQGAHPEEECEAREELERLKRGFRREDSREIPGRERLLVVPASHVHLDEEGPAPPAPGENALGVERKGKPRGHAFA